MDAKMVDVKKIMIYVIKNDVDGRLVNAIYNNTYHQSEETMKELLEANKAFDEFYKKKGEKNGKNLSNVLGKTRSICNCVY